MGKIITVGSGSSGNCYIIENDGKQLIIDLGVSFKEVLPYLNYDISNVVAAVVTHRHVDHSKYIVDCAKYNIPIYTNTDVCSLYPNECKEIKNGQKLKLDGFTIRTFDLIHDVPNSAFVITTDNGIKILFCTDTKYIPKIVKNVNYAIIECNYSDDIIIENAMDSDFSRSHYYNHQELNECITYLSLINNIGLRGVLLSHISSSNGDGNMFVKKVVEELGIYNVDYAKTGLIMEIDEEEF